MGRKEVIIEGYWMGYRKIFGFSFPITSLQVETSLVCLSAFFADEYTYVCARSISFILIIL